MFSRIADCTVLYRRGDVIFVTFGVLVTIGALAWMLVTGACLLALRLPQAHVADFIIGATLSALVGGHGLWWATNLRTLRHEPLLGLRRTGLVSWGGLTGAGAFSVGFAWLHEYPAAVLSDAVVRGMFAAYAIGRVGCLTYGCCYGRVSHAGGVQYRNPDSKVNRERGFSLAPRYPTQLYSAAWGVLLFAVLNAIPYFDVPAGGITITACLVYPLGRAWVEAFRDRERYLGSRVTTGQLACAVMFAAGCALLASLDGAAGVPAPQPLSAQAIRQGLALFPVILLAGALVFAATSIHWKRVGSW